MIISLRKCYFVLIGCWLFFLLFCITLLRKIVRFGSARSIVQVNEASKPIFECLIGYNFALMICGLSVLLLPVARYSHEALIAVSIIFGFSCAIFVSFKTILAVELGGIHRFDTSFTYMLILQAMFSVTGVCVAGQLHDAERGLLDRFTILAPVVGELHKISFTSFKFAGSCILGSVFLGLPIIWILWKERNPESPEPSDQGSSVDLTEYYPTETENALNSEELLPSTDTTNRSAQDMIHRLITPLVLDGPRSHSDWNTNIPGNRNSSNQTNQTTSMPSGSDHQEEWSINRIEISATLESTSQGNETPELQNLSTRDAPPSQTNGDEKPRAKKSDRTLRRPKRSVVRTSREQGPYSWDDMGFEWLYRID